jgi:hypothetical protein
MKKNGNNGQSENGLFRNAEGKLSGTKICFLFTFLPISGIMAAFLLRDLISNQPLTQFHIYVSLSLLILSLINRISARSVEKKVLELEEFNVGMDGLKVGFNKNKDDDDYSSDTEESESFHRGNG